MPLTTFASIAALTAGAVAFVTTGVLLVQPAPSGDPDVWFDFPVAAGTIYAGPVVVSVHTNEPKATAIVVSLSKDGTVVAALTDSELEASGSGAGADILLTASSEWDAPVGHFDVNATVYRGATVVREVNSALTVVGFKQGGLDALDPDVPATPQPSAAPSPSATPSGSATPTPSASEPAEPGPKPTATKPPKPTPTPKPSATTAPQPSVTPEPPVEPLAGKATRSNESNYGWTNTFTITGFRPKTAQMYVEINLRNVISAPYYAGYQSYPCGSPTVYSGSGATATYQCTATFTVQPPGNWRDGEFWRAMPSSVFRSKAVVDGKTFTGQGGSWSPAARPV